MATQRKKWHRKMIQSCVNDERHFSSVIHLGSVRLLLLLFCSEDTDLFLYTLPSTCRAGEQLFGSTDEGESFWKSWYILWVKREFEKKKNMYCSKIASAFHLNFWNSWRETFCRVAIPRHFASLKCSICPSCPQRQENLDQGIISKDYQFALSVVHRKDFISLRRCIKTNLSRKAFNHLLRENNLLPLVISSTNESRRHQWDALHKWNIDYLLRKISSEYLTVATRTLMGSTLMHMQFETYIKYCRQNLDTIPLYLVERNIPRCLLSDYEIPPFIPHDRLERLGKKRPYFRWLIVGPPGSGCSFHCDPDGTSTWNVLVRGKKLWVLCPPGLPPPYIGVPRKSYSGPRYTFDRVEGRYKYQDEDKLYSPPLQVWLKKLFEDQNGKEQRQSCVHVDGSSRDNSDNNKTQFYYYIQKEGDLVYLPPGWWHATLSLTNTIAVSHNLVATLSQ